MGNITSCSCISNNSVNGFLNKSGNKTALVLDSSGNIREMKLPVKSGELMIEELGHVITAVDDLRRTRRVTALGADEELVAGKVYLLVPVSRTRGKASEFEMAIAENWGGCEKNGKRKKLRGNHMVKVSPSPVSTLRERSDEDNAVSVLNEQLLYPRMGNQTRWNPVLDPIFE